MREEKIYFDKEGEAICLLSILIHLLAKEIIAQKEVLYETT